MIAQAPAREHGTLTILSDTDLILALPPGVMSGLARDLRQYVEEWWAKPEPRPVMLLPFPVDVDDQRATRVNEYAGHRVAEDHECFLMNCSGLGPEVIALRDMIARQELDVEILIRAMYARLPYSNWTVDAKGNAEAVAAEYARLAAE